MSDAHAYAPVKPSQRLVYRCCLAIEGMSGEYLRKMQYCFTQELTHIYKTMMRKLVSVFPVETEIN